MHDREDDVDALAHDAVVLKAEQALPVHGRERRAAVIFAVLPRSGGEHAVVLAAEEDPVAILCDADREDIIFTLIDIVQHGFSRTQRDLMLRRDAAKQDTNTQFLQNRNLFSAAAAKDNTAAFLSYAKLPQNSSIFFHNTVILTVENPVQAVYNV